MFLFPGIPTDWIVDVSTASTALEEHLMVWQTLCSSPPTVLNLPIFCSQKNPSAVQKELMESVDELRRNIKSKSLKLKRQQEEHKKAERCGGAITKSLSDVMKRVSSHQDRLEKLMHDKTQLEEALKIREVEIEILQDSRRKERAYLIALKEEEVAEYQKKLDSVKQELEEERKKIPPLKKEIQELLVEMAQKSEEIHNLRDVMEKTNSQLKMEMERVEMKTRELTATAVSHAVHMKEAQASISNDCGAYVSLCVHFPCIHTSQMQLASLEESKKQNMSKISRLQMTIQQKELENQTLSEKIEAKECQEKEQILMELADMKTNMIQLQTEIDQLRTAVKVYQEEARYYQEHATSLRTATQVKIHTEVNGVCICFK